MRPIRSWSNLAYRQAFSESAMPKKCLTVIFAFVIGMLVVLALIKIAGSGYTFGQYLAQQKTQP
jgi:H+/Cl- antiporter ClcA